MNCSFCEKKSKNSNSNKQHEIRCKLNPNRIEVKPSFGMLGKKGGNQWTKAKETGIPYLIKEETRKKLSISSKKMNIERWSKEENRARQSESMKKAVEKYPESYTSSNRGRAKQIIYDGIKFIGNWELIFYKHCKANNIKIERCVEWFEYEWNGKRKYFPDFYLPDSDEYIEIKGYKTDRDEAKWSQFPKHRKLVVLMEKELKNLQIL